MIGVQPLKNMIGRVCIVTGGSRGIGKGIAKILVSSGAEVYITGRIHKKDENFPSVVQTAEELNKMEAGKCYGEYCDHKNDVQVDALFKKVLKKHRKLDILVNNAFSGADNLNDVFNKDFWECNPVPLWEKIIDVGLRSTYICSVIASRAMVTQESGLIVNISSIGSLVPAFGTLYSVGKEGTDRMSVNMGLALKKHKVSVVSLWPGVVKTELNTSILQKPNNKELKSLWEIAEDPTLIGKAVLYLFNDPNLLKKTGKIHYVADLAHEYYFLDVDGKVPTSFRSLRFATYQLSPNLASLVPHCIKVPSFMMSAIFNKF